MFSRVRLSTYSLLLSLITVVILIAACIYCFRETPKLILLLIILGGILFFSMWFAPVSISADPDFVSIKTILRCFRLPVGDIVSIERFQPTMGAVRVCGSGGFMGYWGIFSEGDVGKYKAFYGKASDCFMIIMRNGEKYLLGCQEPEEMIKYIKEQITKNR